VTSERFDTAFGAPLSQEWRFVHQSIFLVDTKQPIAPVSRVRRAYYQRRFLPKRLLATG